jgi:hypothetical protein
MCPDVPFHNAETRYISLLNPPSKVATCLTAGVGYVVMCIKTVVLRQPSSEDEF